MPADPSPVRPPLDRPPPGQTPAPPGPARRHHLLPSDPLRDGASRVVGLPVEVRGPDHVVTQVGAFVEATLGWQVTDGDGLPAVVRLVAAGAAPGQRESVAEASEWSGGRADGLPVIALVGPDDDPLAAAMVAASADSVVAWPGGHEGLADRVFAVLGRTVDPPSDRAPLRVAGAAGGVGTTTVALALGGWVAWGGRPALVVAAGTAPVADVAVAAPDVVAGHRVWAAARPVRDVEGLRVVGCDGPVARVGAPRGVRVVVDQGVAPVGAGGPAQEWPSIAGQAAPVALPDVLVVRRDRAGCEAVREHPGAVVVLVDDGPRSRREVAASAGGRDLVVVPSSVRVVRAHEHRAVPAAMPRQILDALRGVLSVIDLGADSTNFAGLEAHS